MKKYIRLSGKKNRKRIFQSMELTRLQKLDGIQRSFAKMQEKRS